MRPDKFTERAREIIAASQELAVGYRHNQWDIEHLFLALVKQEDDLVAQILAKLGVNSEVLKRKLENILDSAPKMSEGTQIFATPRIQTLLENAGREATQFKKMEKMLPIPTMVGPASNDDSRP